MSYRVTPALIAHIQQIEELRDVARDAQVRVMRQHPAWVHGRDVRLTAFSKLINLFNSLHLSFALIVKSLLNSEWWKSSAVKIPDPSDLSIYVDQFAMCAKISSVVLAVSAAESNLRLVLRGLDPTACSHGTAEFAGVYTCLIKTKLSCPIDHAIELLDLLQTIRNSIHNNGVYFHRSWGTKVATYKGSTYTFQIGQPLGVAEWPVLLTLFRDLVLLIEAIVTDPIVAQMEPIDDPFAPAAADKSVGTGETSGSR